MYIPRLNRVDHIPTLHQIMEHNNFAALVSEHDGAPFATHLPLMLDPTRGEYGTLRGHMARANPQWKSFEASREVLVIFQGPHAYISPSWYVPGQNVPTWNYAIVHAYGVPQLVEEPAALEPMLRELVDAHEAHFEHPWSMELPDDYVQTMIKAIVGFEIPIVRLEGKFKMSQNRSAEDRSRVIQALTTGNDPLGPAVAALMNDT